MRDGRPMMQIDVTRYRGDKYALFNAVRDEFKHQGLPTEGLWEKIENVVDFYDVLRILRESVNIKFI